MRAPSYILAALGISALASAVHFDLHSQRINVSGAHQFIPPGPKDYRGPCPGLNTLANHGFIPHNGVATIEQLINASVEVFGMSVEQATLGATYTTPFTVSPDLNHISIGPPLEGVSPVKGVTTKVPPQGLNFPHTSVEVDASPTRRDKYEPGSGGNNYDLSLPLFQQLLDLQNNIPDDKVNFDLKVLADHRLQRHIDSQGQNPLYFLQPFGGFFLNGNKYSLIYRLFANHSAEYPEGRLDRRTLMSFYGVEADRGGHYGSGGGRKLKYNKGWERIPDNWYRRPHDDPYDLRKSNDDLLEQAKRHPELIDKYGSGGNLVGVNSYRTIVANINQMTNDTYSRKTIREGHNLSCLGFMMSVQLAPFWLSTYYEDYERTIMAKWMEQFPPLIADLNCPILKGRVDPRYFTDMFPGFNASLAFTPQPNVERRSS